MGHDRHQTLVSQCPLRVRFCCNARYRSLCDRSNVASVGVGTFSPCPLL